jgi:DNA gyrase subunit A
MKSNIAEIIPISIEKEMENSYLDYAMSVIVSRAIPDARDGLKPVHRRIIYSMNENGVHSNRAYRKSARIVGDVMGKYHPHGDSAIYDSLVRMAQEFSMSLPLVDGQGNFGSIDGDSPAAMRYTESRMAKAAHSLIEDIDKETVDWNDNYDGTEKEPSVLPAKFPNLLVNGSSGIAVGMATNIPPHNLGEICDAACALIDNPDITIDELTNIVPGPDFPTGGLIIGKTPAISALQTGRGSVIMRGKAEIQDIPGGKQAIIITEVPYMVNKALMVEKIAQLVREKKIEGITDLRDESDKSGIRVVVETKRDAVASVILNQLYKFTSLQTSFGVNMLALDYGRPRTMNLRDMLEVFVAFRKEVITRRVNFDLTKTRERAHVLIGLTLAVDNIDEVISIIRSSPDVNVARERLMEKSWPAAGVEPLIKLVEDEYNVVVKGKCKFTEAQAKAILEMRLSRLTGLEREKITEELSGLAKDITEFLSILGDAAKLMAIIRDELVKVREQFAVPRRTTIEAQGLDEDIEDLIAREDMVVTVTVDGYIKRVPLATYRAQKRGGKGRSGIDLKEEDATTQVFIANTHTPMLFFSTKGKAYKLKTFRLPLGNPQSRGRSMVNIFPLEQNETINVIMPLPENEEDWNKLSIVFATAKGNVRRNMLSDFQSVRANGKIAMGLHEGDELIGVSVANEKDHILLASYEGNALRCPVSGLRVFKGRNSSGVRGMNLQGKDKVISLAILSGSAYETESRDEYLRIPVETRMEIATMLPSLYSPESELRPNSFEEGEQITLKGLRKTGNNEVADKLEQILKDNPINLDADKVIEYACGEQFILTVTENGFGKRSSAYEYRITNRGGKGVTNIVTSERNGNVCASFPVRNNDQIMLVTNAGKLIRCPVNEIRIAGRNTQGVTIFRIEDKEKVISAAHIELREQDASEIAEDAIEAAEEAGPLPEALVEDVAGEGQE